MGDFTQGLIGLLPGRDWSTIARKGLKGAEGCGLPIAGMGDEWNHLRLSCLMPLQCLLHLMVTSVGGQKIFADEQEDNISLIYLFVALLLVRSSCQQLAAIPGGQQSFTLQEAQMFL